MAVVLATRPGEPAGRPQNDDDRFRQELAKLCIRGYADQALQVLNTPKAVQVASSGLDAEGGSALHLAVMGGHLAFTQALISVGCEVDARDNRGRTPLQVSAMESPELTLELLTAGADANLQDDNGKTALHYAVLGASPQMVDILLNHGNADPSIRDSDGNTALCVAAEYGKVEHLELLLLKDPDLAKVPNNSFWTPLHVAAHGMQKKTNSHKPLKFERAVQMLLEAKADVDAKDENCRTALHRAAQAGNTATASALIAAGAGIAVGDECRWTPLHYACEDGHLGVAKLLLDAKAAPTVENPSCLTPLAVATMENQVKMAELLVKYKGDPNCRTKGLQSPLMIARAEPKKYADILALFEIGFINHAD